MKRSIALAMALALALAACIAADAPRSAALAPEKSAVLVATLQEATPELLGRTKEGRERRRIKRELRRLEEVLGNGARDEVRRGIAEFRERVLQPGAGIDLVLREAEADLL